MQITSKFNLDQKVYRVHRSHATLELPCMFCRGARHFRVESPSGSDYEYVSCPRCRGAGSLALVSAPSWAAAEKPLTIGQIRVEITRTTGLTSGLDEEIVERYMCLETGVRSGSLHDPATLFATLAEAEDEAIARNEAIAEGRDWQPERRDVERARSFLEHRDVYEHEPEHVRLAERIIAASEYVEEEA